MTLEEEIAKKLSNEIASEIDFEFLADLYLHDGWTEITLARKPREVVGEMISWCDTLGMIHYGRGQRWLFKEEKDAVFFSLRWL